jgi:multiple sugar transport system ATP-binding protein
MASVEIQKLVKYYGDSQVLHGIDISISDGEFVVLVGPSGCGKSTLLRMVAGLEEISDGHVSIDGQIINDLPPKQRDLAMVFQSYALYPHMTVGENMGFSLRLAKRPKDEISREVARVAEILGLTEYINRYPRHLSGGQRQRVAMGRAIVRDPKVFLFDEPLSNLDAKLRGQMRAEIKNMHRRLATTTIYVTHDQTEAMTMADKIVVLRDGRVEQIGSPMELFKNPRNQFVAGFIGSPSMNFLSGTVNERKIEFPDGTFLPCASEIPLSSGAPVTVGIRPRHFECVDANAAHNFIVDDVEPTGDEMEVRGRMHGETVTAVLETFETNIGQSLKLNSQPSRRFIFDSDTGKRIF